MQIVSGVITASRETFEEPLKLLRAVAELCSALPSSLGRASVAHGLSVLFRYLPPLRAVLLTFDPLPTFAHQTESFPAANDPFTYAKRRNTGNALLSDDGESEEDEGPSQNGEKPVKQVQFKVLPMIEGSGFGLANVEFKGMAWRPRVGQKIGKSCSRP